MGRFDSPDIRNLGRLELLAKQVVEGFIIGLHKSPYHGFSVEFAEHRQYNPGDNLKNIDWKVYARSDRMYTKQFEEETNLRCQLVIDTSSSMYFKGPKKDLKNKITFSAEAAASLMYLLQRQRDAFGLTLYEDEITYQSRQRSSSSHLRGLLVELEKKIDQYTPETTSKTAEILHQVAEATHKRSLVFVFSDFFNDDEEHQDLIEAIQHLRHNKHEVVLFQVTDHKYEIDFDFENRPYEFVDMETGQKVKLQPADVVSYYQNKLKTQLKNLKEICLQYRVDLVEADIHQGFLPIIQSYLIKRSKMRV